MSQPESFPNPVIRVATVHQMMVRWFDNEVNTNTMEEKSVLDDGNDAYYELGHTIRNAIFGQVIHGFKLILSHDGILRRSEAEVAIKIYSKVNLRSLQGRTQENPLTEISALQFIGDNHQNIMGQIECCSDDNNIYSIMRFIQGGELYDLIDENGPRTEIEARVIMRNIWKGLVHLQSLGIGHRDMSLENILFDIRHGSSVIIDFGMCLRMRRNPDTGQFSNIVRQQICGKRNYIAPEVLRQDANFNPTLCDIWAYGIILFILLTGVPAVDTATIADERFRMIVNNRLGEMLQHWGIDLSAEAVELIQSILRNDPLHRLTLNQIIVHPWFLRETAATLYHTTKFILEMYPDVDAMAILNALKSMIQNREDFSCSHPDCSGNHFMGHWNSCIAFGVVPTEEEITQSNHPAAHRMLWNQCLQISSQSIVDSVMGGTHLEVTGFNQTILHRLGDPPFWISFIDSGNHRDHYQGRVSLGPVNFVRAIGEMMYHRPA